MRSLADACDAVRDLSGNRADYLITITANTDVVSVNVGPDNRRTKERADHEARMALVRTICRDLDDVTIEPTLTEYGDHMPTNNSGTYMGQGTFRGVAVIVTTTLNRDEVGMASAAGAA